MYKYGKTLIQKYFDEQSFVDSDIESYNDFMERQLNQIIEENKEIVPTIIPHNIDDFQIRLDKIWAVKPEITEADGSKRNIFPAEARLRKLTYSAPTFIEVSAHINGVQRESFVTQIGNLPIMLKSKWCHLYKLNREELIEKGEDPDEPGGYFIINGTEKVIITIEDLASNKFLTEQDGSEYIGKMFSEYGSFKIPHTMEKLKDGIFYLTFTRVKRIPAVVIIKALGLLKDEEITRLIVGEKQYDEVIINLIEFVSIKTEDDALDYIAKKIGVTQSKEIRIERMKEILDKYLLPHLGIKKEDRIFKAYNLCKMIKKFLRVSRGDIQVDDKDHYMNKKLKMSGDLLADLLRLNLKVLIGDLLYNFQRMVKRGKFPTIKNLIRDKLLTHKEKSRAFMLYFQRIRRE
ncbi:DNA-directed RNA polymerase subunit B'' [Candidatus Woesearchaeota archaeon]|nr:DNA-directed RNA polymerase subunit B'' [Candidatus Woesearchaeota archaeon]